jgi:hypothetical protein
MTPEDYRAMADQCFQWVHDALTVDERRAYLNLARVWLKAAFAEEKGLPSRPPAPRPQIVRTGRLADYTPQLR